MTVKEMWERVQEIFAPKLDTHFEQWLKDQQCHDIYDLERLQVIWWSKQFSQGY